MGLLQPMGKSQAFLKLGGFGFEGSGKTTTLALIAIGLHRHIKSSKPIAFFDTETGSDYVQPLFDFAGIKLVGVKSRSLADLGQTIKEAQGIADILIVDSLTHPYKELCSTYVKNKKDGTHFIRMQDWQPIKDAWSKQFADPYVNSKLHFLWASRAKNLFEDVLDESASQQSGREQFKSIQVGVGARAETESAYEPGILCNFEREMRNEDEPGNKPSKSGQYYRRITIVKDRFMILDGQSTMVQTPLTNGKVDFKKLIDENPTFKFFLPHIERLNIGGDHVGFSGTTSDSLFDDSGSLEYQKRRDEVKIMLEEIENKLVEYYPASQGKDKVAKLRLLTWAFETSSWTAITKMPLELIRAGHEKLVKGDKSKLFEVVDSAVENANA